MSALPSDRAQSALLRALKPWGPFTVLGVRTVPWMSATFEGARHRLALRIDGGDAATRARRLEAELGEAELTIRDGFVADVVVTARLDGEAPVVAIEALTIDDPDAAAPAIIRDVRRAG
jgi:hypothetical protein